LKYGEGVQVRYEEEGREMVVFDVDGGDWVELGSKVSPHNEDPRIWCPRLVQLEIVDISNPIRMGGQLITYP
jgi:hypothetical protein